MHPTLPTQCDEDKVKEEMNPSNNDERLVWSRVNILSYSHGVCFFFFEYFLSTVFWINPSCTCVFVFFSNLTPWPHSVSPSSLTSLHPALLPHLLPSSLPVITSTFPLDQSLLYTTTSLSSSSSLYYLYLCSQSAFHFSIHPVPNSNFRLHPSS